MEDLDALKKEIRNLLVERIGNMTESDQVNLKKRAIALGLDNRQFSQALQEIHASINWDALRDQHEGRDRVIRPINMFGQEVRSLEKLGEVLYTNRTKALKYLDDSVFLKENVTYLSHQNVDLAMELMDIYGSERNTERRYLKICYQLNATLPFSFAGASYDSLESLFEQGWTKHEVFLGIYEKFSAGHLQIWIQKRFIDKIAILPVGDSFRDFLYFLYTLNPDYPFYLKGELFGHLDELVLRARSDAEFWMPLLTSVDDSLLPIWLERKGMGDLISSFRGNANEIRSKEKSSDGLSKSLVQKLIQTLSPETELPNISVSPEKISVLDLQAKSLQQQLVINLTNTGFIRVKIMLETSAPGIWVSRNEFFLSDLEGSKDFTLTLHVDPAKLTKDTLYSLSIKIQTEYQLLRVPVALKTVFPMRAFMLCLLRYSAGMAALFCVVRLLVAASYGSSKWLDPEVAWSSFSAQAPTNHFSYIAILTAALILSFLLWPRIKKIEHL